MTKLELTIRPQPDDTTCGPTCLQAVYRYYEDPVELARIIREVEPLSTGGTLAVCLASHALRRGYRARIYTYNLTVFDPTWFADGDVDLAAKLREQEEAKGQDRLAVATRAYLEYLELGGELRHEELTPALIRRYLKRGRPLLTGLSATYLYGCAREKGEHVLRADDVGGEPVGHFVVLYGYDSAKRKVLIADPLQDNPRFGSHYYAVSTERVIGAVLLGVLTYDANFLVLEPPKKR